MPRHATPSIASSTSPLASSTAASTASVAVVSSAAVESGEDDAAKGTGVVVECLYLRRRKRKRIEDIFKWLDVEERRGEEGRGERVKNYIYNSNTLPALYEGILLESRLNIDY